MELPDLVRESLGDEDVVAGLRLGDEDLVVFTPTRTVLYRGEGLLSDEETSTYPFDFERLQAKRGRRKATFALTYMDDERNFSVPKDRGDRVTERLIEGSLRVAQVVEAGEAVTGVYRFSELTLVVTEGRLLKHVGEYTWDGDFEVFDYGELTNLDFEEGSVATQVVLGTGSGRTERIKAPNQEAGVVRKAVQKAVFAYYDVDSLEALNREIEPEETGEATDAAAGLGLDSGIDPLVSDADDEAEGGQPSTSTRASNASDGAPGAGAESPSESSDRSPAESPAGSSGETAESPSGSGGVEGLASLDAVAVESDPDGEFEAVTAQLDELTTAVERQNELLYRQQQTVKKLIEELKRGR